MGAKETFYGAAQSVEHIIRETDYPWVARVAGLGIAWVGTTPEIMAPAAAVTAWTFGMTPMEIAGFTGVVSTLSAAARALDRPRPEFLRNASNVILWGLFSTIGAYGFAELLTPQGQQTAAAIGRFIVETSDSFSLAVQKLREVLGLQSESIEGVRLAATVLLKPPQ